MSNLPASIEKYESPQSFPPSHWVFLDILSRRTAYGLIWLGRYRQQPCVIKMIMLTTGFHYDKNTQEYRTPEERTISENAASQYFGHNEHKPFYHLDFRHRRSMTPAAFMAELKELAMLGEKGMAPKVYAYGFNRTHPIHYAFIVMQKVDCSLKDIYLHRDLHHSEEKIIKELIRSLHEDHGIIHGDLKPSNIGVFMNPSSRVTKACFFDCQKVRHRAACSIETFQRLCQREANNYRKHIIKNQNERANGSAGPR